MNAASEICFAILTGQAGATVPNRPESVLPTTGFLVGGKVPSLIIEPGSFTVGQVFDWVSAQDADYVGMWVAPSGNVYIDAVDWVVNRGYALGLARRRGELEIRDVEAGLNIPVRHADGEVVTAHP